VIARRRSGLQHHLACGEAPPGELQRSPPVTGRSACGWTAGAEVKHDVIG